MSPEDGAPLGAAATGNELEATGSGLPALVLRRVRDWMAQLERETGGPRWL